MQNVLDFGADPTGQTDSTSAIQDTIDTARVDTVNGGAVLFPTGMYLISEPLVLPRTGLSPQGVVHLVGEGKYQTMLKGAPSFPQDRALVEWEYIKARTWEQNIQAIGFRLPDVDGTKAIHYKLTDKSDWAAVHAERMQIVLRDIYVQSSNSHHEVCIKLEGVVVNSMLENIVGDPVQGLKVHETLLLETDAWLGGSDPFYYEGPGLFCTRVQNLCGMIRRGGYARTFSGRLSESVLDTAVCNGGPNGPSFEFINCRRAHAKNLSTEGQGEKPQYKVLNGRFFRLSDLSIGTPGDVGGSGIGNGIEFVNSNDCRLHTRWALYNHAAFSSLGVKVAVLDEDCNRCVLENVGIRAVNGDGDAEFQIDALISAGNEIHWSDVASGATGVVRGQ